MKWKIFKRKKKVILPITPTEVNFFAFRLMYLMVTNQKLA